jgi:hypothetical protein
VKAGSRDLDVAGALVPFLNTRFKGIKQSSRLPCATYASLRAASNRMSGSRCSSCSSKWTIRLDLALELDPSQSNPPLFHESFPSVAIAGTSTYEKNSSSSLEVRSESSW